MPRRIQTEVHSSVSRLLRGNYLQQPPAWYAPVLRNLPSLPPMHATVEREDILKQDKPFISGSRNTSKRKLPNWREDRKPQKIVYPVDKIRRQFYEDFPFESFRSRSLTESYQVSDDRYETLCASPNGWSSLKQLTINPQPEDAIKFCLHLHNNHNISLSLAYIHATNQFSALKAELEVQKQAAIEEAAAYGASFAPTEIERGYELEERFLNSRLNKSGAPQSATTQDSRQPLIKLSGKEASKLIPNSMSHRAAEQVGYEQGRAYKEAQKQKSFETLENELVQKV
ncbi:hypothetical protein E3Q22_03601 [Wallemia mellicola]|uniref:Small ribosomal subunit protein mS23 n=2 Tax=Wallemia mellicola TaxID=1708541 RepID=A0A4T0PFF9_9BASI|nr:hypothetical protein E3Q23_03452 [Wallemia mellicola]TIB76320.1 hypothetical protein E3Q22_03601 [Wallemia mellicola]TIB95642.1 hypothetical protein E3Q18_03601 [Wallemia mellicola]TIB97070.1 hypothetical protein E3Q17_03575 [Wallemia mellicola]TIC05367.1 hypothetical protein E3Q16_02168 [Wallemia mellicola]